MLGCPITFVFKDMPVLMAIEMLMLVSLFVILCVPVDRYQHFGVMYWYLCINLCSITTSKFNSDSSSHFAKIQICFSDLIFVC
jgi:hypothetical protein